MTKPTPIQGSDGKFKGSIGTGKTDIPAPQTSAIFDIALLRATINTIKTSNPTISMEDLYTIYMEEKTAKETREAEAAAAAQQKADEEAAREAYWASFTPAPGTRIPATGESHQHLPVGTLVKLEDSTEHGGRWNGLYHVKTSPSTWAAIYGPTPEIRAEQAELAVHQRRNNISPYPGHTPGTWVIQKIVDPKSAEEISIIATRRLVPPSDATIGDRVYGNDAATRALPRGTLIRVEDAGEEGWDGTHYLKTSPNTWTAVDGTTVEEITDNSFDLIYGDVIGYPADPQRAYGTWVIVDIIIPEHM